MNGLVTSEDEMSLKIVVDNGKERIPKAQGAPHIMYNAKVPIGRKDKTLLRAWHKS